MTDKMIEVKIGDTRRRTLPSTSENLAMLKALHALEERGCVSPEDLAKEANVSEEMAQAFCRRVFEPDSADERNAMLDELRAEA